jgi:hypothetical protein
MSRLQPISPTPNICGAEEPLAEALSRLGPVFLPDSGIAFDRINSAFAIALHMHQPLIPAGGDDLETARVISNLQYMLQHPEIGDNHNAPAFRWCYKRMGEFIPQLLRAGKQPRVMLDYSGCLLYGLRRMGANDVLDALETITGDPAYRRCVEWLGTAWGHPVAPSTPPQDYRLHVRAWQHEFAALFGLDALARVRGFSPAEMALPNHPDVCFEFVKTLKDCGYRWLLVQEHTVERVEDGGPVTTPHVPHRLVARNSRGETLTIAAILKTQGSDAKLVAQMQPYYEALGLSRVQLAGRSVPPLVTQISDGENGGVMMNDFPPKYMQVAADACAGLTRAANVTEYLEYLESLGIGEGDLPAVQPVMQSRIWQRFDDAAGPEALAKVIAELQKEDRRFQVEGGSWTADRSWVRGYEQVLAPIQRASALFAAKYADQAASCSDPRYQEALFYLLASETSCYRYWGHGIWTDYGRELSRRAIAALEQAS